MSWNWFCAVFAYVCVLISSLLNLFGISDSKERLLLHKNQSYLNIINERVKKIVYFKYSKQYQAHRTNIKSWLLLQHYY